MWLSIQTQISIRIQDSVFITNSTTVSSFDLGHSSVVQETVSEQETIPTKMIIEIDKLRSHLISVEFCNIRALFLGLKSCSVFEV